MTKLCLSAWGLCAAVFGVFGCIGFVPDKLLDGETSGATGTTDCCTTTAMGASQTASPTSSVDMSTSETTESGVTSAASLTGGVSTTDSSAVTTEELLTGACVDCSTTTGGTNPGSETAGCDTDDCGTDGSESGPGDSTEDATTQCMGDCEPRRVFVTFMGVTGDFATGGDAFLKADGICTAEANGMEVFGSFKAWIGVTELDKGPVDRFDIGFEGDYVLAPRLNDPQAPVVVASGWAGLIDGSLKHAIDVRADGETIVGGTSMWTGVASDGTAATSCGKWDTTGGQATNGLYDATDATWTDTKVPGNCSTQRRLYCIEDPL